MRDVDQALVASVVSAFSGRLGCWPGWGLGSCRCGGPVRHATPCRKGWGEMTPRGWLQVRAQVWRQARSLAFLEIFLVS